SRQPAARRTRAIRAKRFPSAHNAQTSPNHNWTRTRPKPVFVPGSDASTPAVPAKILRLSARARATETALPDTSAARRTPRWQRDEGRAANLTLLPDAGGRARAEARGLASPSSHASSATTARPLPPALPARPPTKATPPR